ncbi:MAG: radical SAM protein [Planctomycetaceae bacterium]|nr:radical SAM protein [Planctomycetaceae bacterium]
MSHLSTPPRVPVQAWQIALAEAITDLSELCQLLKLPVDFCSYEASAAYPLLVTRSFLRRIKIADPLDPLLLQILPQKEELKVVPGFIADPLEEMTCIQHSTVLPGIISQSQTAVLPVQTLCLQKYEGRILVLATNECASHCRFCFRRHFFRKNGKKTEQAPFSEQKSFLGSIRNWFGGVTSIKERPTGAEKNQINSKVALKLPVREVILSGGDPLMLTDEELKRTLHYMKESGCGNRVRIHTRLPVMIPERITETLVNLLRHYYVNSTGNSVYIVLHVNHPNELDDEAMTAISRLIDAGIPVLSQSVLLKQINNDFETLFQLFEKLIGLRIIPYYLHQLDHVAGASHFYVSEEQGATLMDQLREALPGYAVPRYVREVAGEKNKVVIH